MEEGVFLHTGMTVSREAQVNGMAVPTGSEFVLEMFVGVPHYTLLTRRPPSLAVEHSLLVLFVLKPPLLAQGSVESTKTLSQSHTVYLSRWERFLMIFGVVFDHVISS
jgi:hypothetical protein